MKKMGNERGFTLIELIIIIVVLGILSAVAVTKYQDLTQDANISATKGNLGTVRAGIMLIHAKLLLAGISGPGEWPTLAELNDNQLAGTRPASVTTPVPLRLVEGPSGATCSPACMPEDFISTQATLTARKTVVSASTAQADTRAVPGGAGGWAYDDQTGQLYVNQTTPLDGKTVPANQW